MEAGSDYYRIISRERFAELRKPWSLTSGQLQRKHPELNLFEAETMRHTLMFYLKLLDDTKWMKSSWYNLCDALLDFKFNRPRTSACGNGLRQLQLGPDAWKNTVDGKHAETVEKLALKLLTSWKKRYSWIKRTPSAQAHRPASGRGAWADRTASP